MPYKIPSQLDELLKSAQSYLRGVGSLLTETAAPLLDSANSRIATFKATWDRYSEPRYSIDIIPANPAAATQNETPAALKSTEGPAIGEIESILDSMNGEIAKIRANYANEDIDLPEALEQLRITSEAFVDLTERFEALETEHDQFARAQEIIVSRLETTVQSQNAELVRLTEDRRTTGSKLDKQTQINVELRQFIDDQSRTIRELNDEVHELLAAALEQDQTMSELREDAMRSAEINTTLRAQLTAATAGNSILQSETERLTSQNATLTASNAALTATSEQRGGRIEILETQNRDHEAAIGGHLKTIAGLREELEIAKRTAASQVPASNATTDTPPPQVQTAPPQQEPAATTEPAPAPPPATTAQDTTANTTPPPAPAPAPATQTSAPAAAAINTLPPEQQKVIVAMQRLQSGEQEQGTRWEKLAGIFKWKSTAAAATPAQEKPKPPIAVGYTVALQEDDGKHIPHGQLAMVRNIYNGTSIEAVYRDPSTKAGFTLVRTSTYAVSNNTPTHTDYQSVMAYRSAWPSAGEVETNLEVLAAMRDHKMPYIALSDIRPKLGSVDSIPGSDAAPL